MTTSHASFTVKQKFAVVMTAVVGVVGLGAVLVASQLNDTKTQAVEASQTAKASRLLGVAHRAWLTVDDQVNMYAALLALRDPENAELARDTWTQVNDASSQLDTTIHQLEELIPESSADSLQRLHADIAAYMEFVAQADNYAKAGDINAMVKAVTVDNAAISNSVADEFTTMDDDLNRQSSVALADIRQTAGDSQTAIEVGSIIGVLFLAAGAFLAVRSIRRLTANLSQEVAGVADSTDQVSVVAEQFHSTSIEGATQAHEVAATAEQVAENVSSMAVATEQIESAIGNVAHAAAEAAAVATDAVRLSNGASRLIEHLGQTTGQIEESVTLIAAIARQTNLLALNATIEAARAGDAGRGFAVVASEVQTLAHQTEEATASIRNVVTELLRDASNSVASFQEISSIIETINDNQTSIAAAVEEQSASIRMIAQGVQSASIGMGHITDTIHTVAETAQNNTGAASHAGSAARNLSQRVHELEDLVSLLG